MAGETHRGARMKIMTAKVIELPVMVRLQCSVCGASGEGSCRCGAPYVPAGQRAAEAVKANPEKSDRQHAKELKLGHATVSRARKTIATGVSDETPEKRIGKDGKSYPARRMPKKEPPAAQEPSKGSFGENCIKTMDAFAASYGREYGFLAPLEMLAFLSELFPSSFIAEAVASRIKVKDVEQLSAWLSELASELRSRKGSEEAQAIPADSETIEDASSIKIVH